jgi:actin-related protein
VAPSIFQTRAKIFQFFQSDPPHDDQHHSSSVVLQTKNMAKQAAATATAPGGSTKKRQRTATSAAAAPSRPAKAAGSSSSLPPSIVPLRTIVLDNGGDTVKYGWSTDDRPSYMPNLTGRLPQQYWSVLVGDQVLDGTLQNPNACHTSRSMERYMIHNLGNQVQVWKRILDKMNVAIMPNIKHPQYSELPEVFGWTTENAAMAGSTMIPATQCAVMIGLPLFMPRLILEQILHVFWYDFGISHVGFYASAAAAAQPTRLLVGPKTSPGQGPSHGEDDDKEKGNKGATAKEAPANELATTKKTNQTTNHNRPTEQQPDDDVDGLVPIACVVDLGWSGTTIVPVYRDRVILTTTKYNNTNNYDDDESPQHRVPIVRRLHFGGRHMIQMLKYYLTYRQYNLMEQEFVLRHVLETTFYVSLQYDQNMRMAADSNTTTKRPLYDLDYILPDYETTKVGVVQVPASVQRQLDRIKAANDNSGEKTLLVDEDEDDEDADDEDFRVDENQMQDDDDDDVALVPGTVIEVDNEEDEDNVDEDDDDDDEEEDETTMRERVLAQRRAEEERRRDDEAARQVLRLSLERFAIPELLFAPQDGNLPAEWAALPTAIIQCIESCPEPYRAGLYRSIQLTGGLSMLPGLRSRLLREIRRLVHPDYNADYNENDEEEKNEPHDDKPTATFAPPPLLHIRILPDPMEASWRGGCRLVNNNDNHHQATKTDPAAVTTTGHPFRWCVSLSAAGTPSASSTGSTAAAAATGTASASLRKQLITEGGYYF